MGALLNSRWELFVQRRVMAIRTGESPEKSYIEVFGEASEKQAKSRSRVLLDKPQIKERIAQYERQAEIAAQRAAADSVVTKDEFDKFVWELAKKKPSEIDLDTEGAEIKYSKDGEALAVKPSVVGLLNVLGKSKGYLKQNETSIVLADWQVTRPVRDVGPRTRNLEEGE